MSDSAKSRARKPRLGRGLSSLVINSAEPAQPTGGAEYQSELHGAQRAASELPPPADETQPLREIAVDQIGPNPYQPRREFDPTQLESLADSIRRQGLIQPLVVAPAGDGADRPYRLVAGERRLRAARTAGLTAVACIVRQAGPRQLLEWALVENIHRADLNPIERAEAYRQYIDRFSLSQGEAADRLGQSRATIANHLRLLDLQEDVRQAVSGGRLTFGHAKVLAALANRPERQRKFAQRAIDQGLNVRQLERLVTSVLDTGSEPKPPAPAKPPYLRDLEEQLTRTVGTPISVHPGRAKHSGRIVIQYHGLEEFDRICEALGAKLED